MTTQEAEGIIVGYGKYVYQHVPGWGKLPEGWKMGHAVGVAIDSKERIYVYCRNEHPVLVFDTDGNLLDHWGEGLVGSAHMITAGPDDSLYTTDIGNHTVRKWSPKGEILMELGTPDKPAPEMSGEPFNRPTHVTVAPDGSLYITDGYGNARVHHYSADGKHLNSWGEPGTGPGQFRTPHGSYMDPSGQLFVVDRENYRIQVFTKEGAYIREFYGVNRPDHIWRGDDGDLIVSELGFRQATGELPQNAVTPPAGLKFLTPTGQWMGGWGMSTDTPGDIIAAHSVVTDRKGDLYCGETLAGARVQKYKRIR